MAGVRIFGGRADFAEVHVAEGRNIFLQPHEPGERIIRGFAHPDLGDRESLLFRVLPDTRLHIGDVAAGKSRAAAQGQ